MANPNEIKQIPLKSLSESPLNHRRLFGDLDGLAATIKEQGLLQAVTVRKVGGTYELVFGHRRFRAARLAGLASIPAVVREMTDDQVVSAQLAENISRDDITELEKAEGYKRLMQVSGKGAEHVAQQVGVSRASVYRTLTLLDLAEPVKKALDTGRISVASATVIATLVGERLQLAVLKKFEEAGEKLGGQLSARASQQLAKSFGAGKSKKAHFGTGSDDAALLKRRTKTLLLSRVTEALERKNGFDPEHLRLMLLALVETDNAAMELLQGMGFKTKSKERPERLRALLGTALISPWLESDETTRLKVVAGTFGLDFGELEKTAKQLLAAEELVGK